MNQDAMSVFNLYNEALTKGDFAAVFETMADDIKWHQPGNNPLSGVACRKTVFGCAPWDSLLQIVLLTKLIQQFETIFETKSFFSYK